MRCLLRLHGSAAGGGGHPAHARRGPVGDPPEAVRVPLRLAGRAAPVCAEVRQHLHDRPAPPVRHRPEGARPVAAVHEPGAGAGRRQRRGQGDARAADACHRRHDPQPRELRERLSRGSPRNPAQPGCAGFSLAEETRLSRKIHRTAGFFTTCINKTLHGVA
ncbi:hypothetical protein OF001_U190019 [Pseudomonas sp. OF001]|nr:hypothetical protein OF001_U190019 [Pseudomonas sp. OF001]